MGNSTIEMMAKTSLETPSSVALHVAMVPKMACTCTEIILRGFGGPKSGKERRVQENKNDSASARHHL